MKTVGDFKNKKGVVVEGDVIASGNFDKELPLKKRDAVNINGGNHLYERALLAFAWRTNTGVKPEFSGMVVFKDAFGEVFKIDAKSADWRYRLHVGHNEWRPHLPSIPTETPEEKAALDKIDEHVSDASNPVYTQAMCDAGVKVIAGMMFTTEVGREYCAAMVNDKSVCFEDEDGFLVGMPIGRAKPIQTKQEKLAEQMHDIFNETYYKGKERPPLSTKWSDCPQDVKDCYLAIAGAGLLK